MSFLIYEAQNRLGNENKLIKLSKIIDWSKIGKNLKGMYSYEINGLGGQKPYDSLKMFKAILLGQWHNLSDPELELALKVRLDFMMFTELQEDVPDETTLCRFRNRLIKKGLDKKLMIEINKQLETTGLKIKECEGAVVDATIVESAGRPRKIIKEIAEDRNESEKEKVVEIEYSKDSEAKWLKKGKKYYFGYKAFATTDSKDGYIENVHVVPANESEVRNFEKTLPDRKIKTLYADKGYASKENRKILKDRGIRDGILYKAQKNKPLTHWQKVKNKIISTKRFIVEQSFGTLKRKFKFHKARYFSQNKVLSELRFKAICLNLLKAVNKVELV